MALNSRKAKESSSRYRIEAGLNIDGKEYLVTKVSMINVDNSIPTIECYVVPEAVETGGDSKPNKASRQGEEPIAKGEVGYFLEQNNKLSNLKGGFVGSVEFRLSVIPEQTGTKQQALDTMDLTISDWVVVDAGISSLSRNSPVTAAKIVLQHPMYKYNRLPLGLMVKYKPAKNKKLTDVKNILEGLKKGIKKYIEDHDPKNAKNKSGEGGGTAGETLRKMDEERVAELRELYEGIDDVIVWDAKDADGNVIPPEKPGFPFSWIYSFNRYASQIFAEPEVYYDNTMFHALLRGIVPMFLGVSGEFGLGKYNPEGKSEPMAINHRNPWEVPYCEVNVDSLVTLTLPVINTPLEAVVIQGRNKYGSPYSTLKNYEDTASAMALQRTDVAAAYFEHVDKLKGVVVYSKPPSWMTGYITDTGRKVNRNRKPVSTKGQSKEKNYTNARRAKSKAWFEMMKRYAKDVFYDRFYKGSKSSWSMRFLPYVAEEESGSGGRSYKNLELKPGVVISLVEDVAKRSVYSTRDGSRPRTERKERMRMFVTHVIHDIDVNAGTAKTTIMGTHARGPDGATDPNTTEEIVKERKLAIYDKSEKVK